jgi:hypothetical protein
MIRRFCLLVVFVVAGLSLAANADEPATLPSISFEPPAPARPALTFPMNERAGKDLPILIPVTVLGKQRLLMLDTGCTGSLLDKSLAPQLGEPVGRATVANLQDYPIPLHRAPVFDVRGTPLPIPSGQVAITDFSEFRTELRSELDGILGQDVLTPFVVRLDFHARAVELIDPLSFKPPAPSDRCSAFPLRMQRGIPYASLPILGLKDVPFQIDTGCREFGFVTPDIENELGDAVFKKKEAEFITAAGTRTRPTLLIARPWRLAATDYDELHLGVNNRNVVGLALLANYIVTFDFPHNTLYLENLYDKDPTKYTQVQFAPRNGRLLVTETGIKAHRLGIRVDDEVVAIGGEPLAGKSIQEIAQIMQKHGSQTTFQFRRGDKVFDVTPSEKER